MSNIIEVGYGEALQFGVEQGTYIRIGSRDEIEALHAENKDLKQQVEQGKRDAVPDDIRRDADRYRWLKSQKGLALSSCGGSWIKGNIKFNASHRLCANGTAYAPYETLDEAIDAAIAAAPKQEK